MTLEATITELCSRTRQAAKPLARAGRETRTKILHTLASVIESGQHEILEANAKDLAYGQSNGLSAAMMDRLKLDDARLAALAASVRDIAEINDPVGEVADSWTRPNGLEIQRLRLPLGVIMMIYESRPNVTIDAAALCIRSGNATILRGGTEAQFTNRVLASCVGKALSEHDLPAEAVSLVPIQDREAIDHLLNQSEYIDLVIPRGGEGLIRRVVAKSRIPVIQHYKGVCHVFVDKEADLDIAHAIAINAKTQRPGVCNALETLLIHQDIASTFLPLLYETLQHKSVEVRGCERVLSVLPSVKTASEEDWDTEFLDLILAIRVVDDLDAAIEHIDRHGSSHTASIVTKNKAHASEFLNSVEASCVMVNASTRFNDGGELGLGAEMGISTTRIHAFGPMGVESLTSLKYAVIGEGQIRR
ncbi:MAG: glutamate-5-semialdehyde dehydrogenase [Myxococcota bacterium]|nr:glutamate-5-semialdehyde dehydrogenase [Myxococcota bacterium]